MRSPKLYYIRHGQTDWNAELRYQGRMDIPLNDYGRAQAKRNGETLAGALENTEDCNFISSPLSRTRETMEIVRTQLGLAQSVYDIEDRLIEIAYGDFEGNTRSELAERMPEQLKARKADAWHFRPENGESHEDALTRISDWYGSLDPNITHVVVAHGAAGRVLRHHVLGIPTDELASFSFPQDKVCLLDGSNETWL